MPGAGEHDAEPGAERAAGAAATGSSAAAESSFDGAVPTGVSSQSTHSTQTGPDGGPQWGRPGDVAGLRDASPAWPAPEWADEISAPDPTVPEGVHDTVPAAGAADDTSGAQGLTAPPARDGFIGGAPRAPDAPAWGAPDLTGPGSSLHSVHDLTGGDLVSCDPALEDAVERERLLDQSVLFGVVLGLCVGLLIDVVLYTWLTPG